MTAPVDPVTYATQTATFAVRAVSHQDSVYWLSRCQFNFAMWRSTDVKEENRE